jgi:hypothetical protein
MKVAIPIRISEQNKPVRHITAQSLFKDQMNGNKTINIIF